MSARPWMPFYFGDYLADTGHLSTLEHGAYLLLIAHYWMKAGLPTDDDKLARIARLNTKQWNRAKPALAAFFSDDWKHKRIEFEMTEAARISDAGRAGGKASAEARRQSKSLNNNTSPPTTAERPSNDQTNDQATIGQALQPQPQLQREVSKQERAERAPAEKVPSRGTRLSDGWAPDLDGYQFAVDLLGSKPLAQSEFEKFRDYWRAKAGAGARKVDWGLTWKTWIRTANERRGKTNGTAKTSLSDQARELADQARELERAAGIGSPSFAFGGTGRS